MEVRPTHYLYPGGDEPGVLVGLINYPRFPLTPEAILGHALDIAQQMKERFQQERLSVVCSDYTYLLGDL